MEHAAPYLVCLDIDGTTITHDGVLRAPVADAIRAVRAAGHHVVMSTGRSVTAALPYVEELELTTGYAVCSNGAVTIRLDPSAPNGHVLDEVVTFDPAPALDLLHGRWPDVVFAVEEVGVGHRISAPFPEGELIGDLTVVSFEELRRDPVTRVTVRSPGTSAEEFDRVVEEVGLHGVSYAVGFSAWLDITPEGVTKASALEIVRRRLGVEPQHTVAVGDQRNDIEMLRWAARGGAMGNAPEEVQAVADEVTLDVDHDGLVPVLTSLL